MSGSVSTFEERWAREAGQTMIINGLTVRSLPVLWSTGSLHLTTWKRHVQVSSNGVVLGEDILDVHADMRPFMERCRRQNAEVNLSPLIEAIADLRQAMTDEQAYFVQFAAADDAPTDLPFAPIWYNGNWYTEAEDYARARRENGEING